MAPGEQPTLVGSAVRLNRTPMDAALSCLGRAVAAQGGRVPVIAVGDVRDYTGKYSVNEGNAVTQGGALMVTSALGKTGAVRIAERFDPTIGERELGYTDHRQLGDGVLHPVSGSGPASQVPWLPYYGGSIAASDYYIVGGITELNYDIRSGGFDASVSQVGPKARLYTQSVAVDLRIVDTRSLIVLRTVSLTKQFTGYEVGFNLFRFFGSDLFDVGLGAKGQEPLQLGIRTALEEATLRLVGAVTHVDPASCLALQSWTAMSDMAMAPTSATVPIVARAGAALNSAASGLPTGAAVSILFGDGSAELPSSTGSLLTRIVAARPRQAAELTILARDSEPSDPGKRDPLTDRRIAAVAAAIAALGATDVAIRIIWRPATNDSAVYRADAGFQTVARLSLG
jgi:curli biogenesis system outer membrane secretion channel CsgG